MEIMELAKAYEASQKALVKAQTELDKARQAEGMAWEALEGFRAASTSKFTKGTKRGRRRSSGSDWSALRELLPTKMKNGKKYKTSELRELTGYTGKSADFSMNVISPLKNSQMIGGAGTKRGPGARWSKL